MTAKDRKKKNTPPSPARDKASLDIFIFWPRDESLSDADSLPPPSVIA